jgi:hypothetical protein
MACFFCFELMCVGISGCHWGKVGLGLLFDKYEFNLWFDDVHLGNQ